MDDSSQLTTKLKNHYKGIKQLKFITKQFLKHSFKTESFDALIMPKLWSWIPIESELNYLNEIQNVIKKEGFIVIGAKIGEVNKQGWKVFSETTGDIYFEKMNEKPIIERQFNQNGLVIVNVLESGEFTYYVLKKS
jgi:ubiquinone/menaquinone biosynthesis C-methylase UbiE